MVAIRRSAYDSLQIGQSQVEAMSKFHFVSLDVQLNTSAREDLSTWNRIRSLDRRHA